MYVDEALPKAEVSTIALHIESCPQCRIRLAEFHKEKQLIGAALYAEDPSAVPAIKLPNFTKPISLRGFAMANVITGLLIWLAQFLWKTIFGELIISAFTRITLIQIPDAYELLVTTTLYFTQEGTPMIDTYLGFVVLSLVLLALVWFSLSHGRSRNLFVSISLILVSGSLVAPTSVNALELRHDEIMMTIDASETIDDTLIIAAETVVIDGNIEGDVFAFGERVIVNGTIGGNLVTFAETVSVQGEVGGFALGGAESFELNGATITGDFWGAASKVNIGPGSRIGRNASIASEKGTIAGSVGRDLMAFAETVELSGTVSEDFEAYANRVNLLGDSSITGNLRFHSGQEENLRRAPTAVVKGEVEFLPTEAGHKHRNRYATGKFYILQLIRLVSAFAAGLALFWIIPGLRDVTLGGGVDGLITTGVGLITLISLPIVMILVAITVIGIPFTVVGLFAWMLAIYLAKIVVASIIGQLLLSSSDKGGSLPITLLAGLTVVLVAINLPGIGGVISFILTIVGIGIIVQELLDYMSGLYRG
jgi:hypothetical protein